MQCGETPTIKDAAEAAGVSRATAYRYFTSQQALLLETSLDAIGTVPDPSLVDEGPVESRVDAAIRSLVRMAYEHEPVLRTFRMLSLEQWLRTRQQSNVNYTASSFHSRAWLAGRCRVQSRAPRIFHTWPGWYSTPVKRSMTAATRGRVHKSVPKPRARAPWRRARSTRCRCWRFSFGLRPARPAPRRAAMPPSRHCPYQRLTLWRLTCGARATEARISPERNS